MPSVYATALPAFPPAMEGAVLRALCARWERWTAPRLAPEQRAHCRRFAPQGEALRARASRLLVRLLAFRALPACATIHRDEAGRPRVDGAPGWQVAFTHSGRAAFCLVCGPGETPPLPGAEPALDAEAWDAPPPADRAFGIPASIRGSALRRWLLAEALFKALGARQRLWGAVAGAAEQHRGERAGSLEVDGARLGWRFFPAPGHLLCAALPGGAAAPLRLHWLPWQALA